MSARVSVSSLMVQNGVSAMVPPAGRSITNFIGTRNTLLTRCIAVDTVSPSNANRRTKMAHIKVEIDRGNGWQVRQEGDCAATINELRATMPAYALSYPHRFYIDGELVGEIVRRGRKLVCETRSC